MNNDKIQLFLGPALAGVSIYSNNPAIVGQGVFATASFATFKMRKDVELWEICFTMLQKVPKAYNKVSSVITARRNLTLKSPVTAVGITAIFFIFF